MAAKRTILDIFYRSFKYQPFENWTNCQVFEGLAFRSPLQFYIFSNRYKIAWFVISNNTKFTKLNQLPFLLIKLQRFFELTFSNVFFSCFSKVVDKVAKFDLFFIVANFDLFRRTFLANSIFFLWGMACHFSQELILFVFVRSLIVKEWNKYF